MKLKGLLLAGVVTMAGVLGMALPEKVMAVTCPEGSLRPSANSIAECNIDPANDTGSLMETITTIINVILGVVGVVAVIMIIIGGISFITSQGDAAKVTRGKNTVLYGVVGLVIALLAFMIVNFVLSGVFGTKG